MRRVVITGMGGYSPLGSDVGEAVDFLKSCKSAVKRVPELSLCKGMLTSIGAKVEAALPEYSRKRTRTMGRVGILAAAATEKALADANLAGDPSLGDGSCGIAYGSCGGSAKSMKEAGMFACDGDCSHLSATTYAAMMPHTVAVNLAMFFGIKGRIIATSTACTSGSQAVGYAYEAIKSGAQDVMIAGGADEFSPFTVAVFDVMFATAQDCEDPSSEPRPFDRKRDGIVAAEGAGTLILEEYGRAVARGAKIYAEIVGFATNCDAMHITEPSSPDMEKCMRLALGSAGLEASDIGYINAHGTGTAKGDAAESNAMYRLFGSDVPVSTIKGCMGHAMGAAGALEAIYSIEMMNRGWFAPTLNLSEPSDECGKLDYVIGHGRDIDAEYVMSNNFAFGGVNTSLIFRKTSE